MPYVGVPKVLVPENVVDFTLPTLELTRAGEVRGLVVSEGARPAVGVEVMASWSFNEGGRYAVPTSVTVRTGPDGRFVVDRVPEGVEVGLSAYHRAFRTAEPGLSGAGEASILQLEPANCRRLGAPA